MFALTVFKVVVCGYRKLVLLAASTVCLTSCLVFVSKETTFDEETT